jgi:hypothetical protein
MGSKKTYGANLILVAHGLHNKADLRKQKNSIYTNGYVGF